MQHTLVVTGGAGFVGVNFIRHAHHKGYRIIIVDTADRLKRLENLEEFSTSRLTFCPLNLAEQQLSFEEDVHALIHFAALPHVDYSFYNSERVITNNVTSLLKVVETARTRHVPLLFISSIEVYGGNQEGLIYENTPYQPLSPYAASKVCGETILQTYMNMLGVTASIARLTNLYGPWQAPDRLIPRLVTQILSEYPCEVEGGRLRDFLYVDDAVRALLGIVEQARWGEVFNVSSGYGVDNTSLIPLLQAVASHTIDVSYIDARQNDGRGYSLISSPHKLQQALDWQPAVSLQAGLRLTYDWYASHPHWWKQFDQNIRSDRTKPQFLTDYTHDFFATR